MSDAALRIVPIRYRCRVCASTTSVHVSPDDVEGEQVIDAHNVRLWHGHCETCEQERMHVADPEGVDVDLDAAREESWGGRSV